jgi:glycerol-3-phosphate acyltransferase PlsY
MILSFNQLWWQFLLLIIFSYLMGNINFAIIISKLKKQDIRTMGSGNPGTLNMSRNFGLKIGLLTLVLDMLKGAIPTFLGFILYQNCFFDGTAIPVHVFSKVMCGFFAVVGHIFPVFMKFKGGKGIATTIGVFFVCSPLVGLISGILAIVFILLTEIGAMGSFIATTPGAFVACYSIFEVFMQSGVFETRQIVLTLIANLFVIGIIFLTWFAHRQNIKRLLMGEEHPTNWLQMLKEMKYKKKTK